MIHHPPLPALGPPVPRPHPQQLELPHAVTTTHAFCPLACRATSQDTLPAPAGSARTFSALQTLGRKKSQKPSFWLTTGTRRSTKCAPSILTTASSRSVVGAGKNHVVFVMFSGFPVPSAGLPKEATCPPVKLVYFQYLCVTRSTATRDHDLPVGHIISQGLQDTAKRQLEFSSTHCSIL